MSDLKKPEQLDENDLPSRKDDPSLPPQYDPTGKPYAPPVPDGDKGDPAHSPPRHAKSRASGTAAKA